MPEASPYFGETVDVATPRWRRPCRSNSPRSRNARSPTKPTEILAPPAALTGQPWGNSQFSMTVEALGDLRFHETYEGRGFEDVDFLRQVAAKFGDRYVGKNLDRSGPCHTAAA